LLRSGIKCGDCGKHERGRGCAACKDTDQLRSPSLLRIALAFLAYT
jgi:hypothetical protein